MLGRNDRIASFSLAQTLGIDNLNVLRSVDRGIEGTSFSIVKDGDLLATVHSMLGARGEGTVKVSEVQGHADQAMVVGRDVRNEDRIGNDGADWATWAN